MMLVGWFLLSELPPPSSSLFPPSPLLSLWLSFPRLLGWSYASAWRRQSWNRKHKSASFSGLSLEGAASLCSIFLGPDLSSPLTSRTQLSPCIPKCCLLQRRQPPCLESHFNKAELSYGNFFSFLLLRQQGLLKGARSQEDIPRHMVPAGG